MARQSHSRTEHQRLATHADVHQAFKHISEIKALAILALRPTSNEIDAAAQRLDDTKRRAQTHRDTDIVDAIIGILAGEHAQ
jgi:hypothetical protein